LSRPVILVVEDDRAVRRGLVDVLHRAGYKVLEAEDGVQGAETAATAGIDLVLLDVMLPRRDGFDVLDEIGRVRPGLPVILVTARGAEEDRVRGLQAGADDYVVKPFSAPELLARVEAVLRRSAERPRGISRLRIGARLVDLERRIVARDGSESVDLTEREVEILRYLADHRDRAVPREELLLRVWRINPKGLRTRTVDMHIARLRAKLQIEGEEEVVHTVRARGYRLADGVTEAEGA
jgi:DNA-binding response OmpR family regulator